MNVEEASPGDFIPLPAGSEGRHEFIERFRKLDVFHFDLYSVALSKIERGRTQDLEDVLKLLQVVRSTGIGSRGTLRRFFPKWVNTA